MSLRNVVCSLAVAALSVPVPVCLAQIAADQDQLEKNPRSSRREPAPALEVEMFEAMDKGQIEVRFLPRDVTTATIAIENKTGQPLQVKLPETFGALPVLGQMMGGMGGMGMGGMGMGGMGMGGMGGMGMGGMGGMGMGGMGGMQGMGGGMGGMGMGGMGMGGMGMGGMGGMGMGGMGGMGGMMGGMMRVEPDRPRKFPVATLCLEQGKEEPRQRSKYRICRLEEVNPNPHVAEICRALGYGQINPQAAQAAMWHFTDQLSWGQLAALPRRVDLFSGRVDLYFSRMEIQNAIQIAAASQKLVAARALDDGGYQDDYRQQDDQWSQLLQQND